MERGLPEKSKSEDLLSGAASLDRGAVNAETLDRLRHAIGSGPLAEFVGVFLEELPDRFRAIADALDRRDAQALLIAAHGLKNSCGHFGARRMMAMCDLIEQNARRGLLELPT